MSLIYADVPASVLGVSGIWGPAIPNGAPSVSFPLESQGNYARLYAQPFLVHTGADVPGATGEPGIFSDTFLVAESERQPLAGGFVTFNRFFAEIPSGFNDFETITYPFPLLYQQRTDQKVSTVVCRVWNDFFLTDNPQSVTLSGATRFVNQYGWDTTILLPNGYIGASTNPTTQIYAGWVASGTELIAQDAKLTRFIGPIWRRETPYIRAQ